MEQLNYIIEKKHIQYLIYITIIISISILNNLENELKYYFNNIISKIIFLIIILISAKYNRIIGLLLACLYVVIISKLNFNTSESLKIDNTRNR